MIEPLDVIEAIRESFIGSEQVYKNGSCFYFFKILKSIFPNARGHYLSTKGHIVTEINNRFYDISGEVKISSFEPIYKVDITGEIIGYMDEMANNWKFNIYDVHIECPNCEELFFRAELEPEYINETKKRYGKLAKVSN